MLEDFITLPGLTTAGTGVLVTLFVLFIYLGRLVPRASVEKMEKAYDATIKSLNEEHTAALAREREISLIWKDAYQSNLALMDTKEQTLRDAIDGLKTVEFLIRAMRAIGEERQDAVAALEIKNNPP